MSKLVIVARFLIVIIGVSVMCFVANFWIGTEEKWEENMEYRFLEFFLSRTSLTFVAGLIFLFLHEVVSYFGRRKAYVLNGKRLIFLLYTAIGILLISIFFVLITLTK